MRLLTTQEFSEMLEYAYNLKSSTMTLGEALYHTSRNLSNDNLKDLLEHARMMEDYLYSWENPLAVIKYFIDNFVEEF